MHRRPGQELVTTINKGGSTLHHALPKQINLNAIPDSIRTGAIFKSGMMVGPQKPFRSISTKRSNGRGIEIK